MYLKQKSRFRVGRKHKCTVWERRLLNWRKWTGRFFGFVLGFFKKNKLPILKAKIMVCFLQKLLVLWLYELPGFSHIFQVFLTVMGKRF